MHKPIKINNEEHLYEVTIGDKVFICTIENVGRDEYHAYCDEGDGSSVLQLDTVDIMELISTHSLIRDDLSIQIR